MKKILAAILSLTLMCSFSACGKTNSGNSDTSEVNDSSEVSISDSQQTESASPLELLTAVWNSYGEDEKFAVAGGDMSEENASMDGPGTYSLEDPAAVDTALGFPAASVAMIDDAASLVHMMNANTFTCGAYHVANTEDIAAASQAIKENIMNRQWLCGFPDKLVIVTVDDCIVSFFGENEIVDTFKGKLTEAYPSVQLVSEDPIA